MSITIESIKRCYYAKNASELHLDEIAEWLKVSDIETSNMEIAAIKNRVSSIINGNMTRIRNKKKFRIRNQFLKKLEDEKSPVEVIPINRAFIN